MNEEEKCVHTEHCCIIHGCKYGDEDCPVVSGEKSQSYLCESCSEEGNQYSWAKIHKQQVFKDLERINTVENLKKENARLSEELEQMKEALRVHQENKTYSVGFKHD